MSLMRAKPKLRSADQQGSQYGHDEITVEQAYDGSPIKTISLDGWAKADAFLERAQARHADRRNWLPAHQRIRMIPESRH
jgi:hypothetical protein